MHNLECVEGDHEGRPHVFEGIGRNAVGAGLVPAPNATRAEPATIEAEHGPEIGVICG